jgi:hypothetical protein
MVLLGQSPPLHDAATAVDVAAAVAVLLLVLL